MGELSEHFEMSYFPLWIIRTFWNELFPFMTYLQFIQEKAYITFSGLFAFVHYKSSSPPFYWFLLKIIFRPLISLQSSRTIKLWFHFCPSPIKMKSFVALELGQGKKRWCHWRVKIDALNKVYNLSWKLFQN
jgi:hypothetical protein